MSEQRYRQYCALALALDVVGGRWTFLIVRELWPGPRRFTDLVDGLPGISRKLLTERLRDLEEDGIITRKELPPPAARQVYELTADGRDLAAALIPLIGWASKRLGKRKRGEDFRPRWAAVGMAALADRDAAKGVHETYQYLVGGSAFHLVVDDGSISVRDGESEDAVVVVTTDEQTWVDIVSGKITAGAAHASGAPTVEGDRQAAKRLRKIFARDLILSRAREGAFAPQRV
jgi:DNA-binding HxlR family transcriptional regulator/putative sterol carrier protein